jgi:hypothetical protein
MSDERPLCGHNLEEDGHDPAPQTRHGTRANGRIKWRCGVKDRANQDRFRASALGKAYRRKKADEYETTPEALELHGARQARYMRTKGGRMKRRDRNLTRSLAAGQARMERDKAELAALWD